MTKEEIIQMAKPFLWGGNVVEGWTFNSYEQLERFAKMVAEKAIKEALAQPKQEPLAWISTGPASMIHWTADKPAYGDDWVPLYTTPPQRTWVGLTKEEIAEFDTWHDNREEEVGWCNPSEIVAYIEAKLRSKNNG